MNRTRMITPTRDTKKGNRTSMTDLANTDTGKRNRTGMISFAPQSAFTIVPVLLIKVLEYAVAATGIPENPGRTLQQKYQ